MELNSGLCWQRFSGSCVSLETQGSPSRCGVQVKTEPFEVACLRLSVTQRLTRAWLGGGLRAAEHPSRSISPRPSSNEFIVQPKRELCFMSWMMDPR